MLTCQQRSRSRNQTSTRLTSSQKRNSCSCVATGVSLCTSEIFAPALLRHHKNSCGGKFGREKVCVRKYSQRLPCLVVCRNKTPNGKYSHNTRDIKNQFLARLFEKMSFTITTLLCSTRGIHKRSSTDTTTKDLWYWQDFLRLRSKCKRTMDARRQQISLLLPVSVVLRPLQRQVGTTESIKISRF